MEEKEKQAEEVKVTEKVQTEIDKLIKEVVDDGISSDNLDYLYRLIDIHKDLANEEYWNVKKEGIKMRYKDYGESEMYGNYGEDSYGRRSRDSRGRYTEDSSYGRRGRDAKYRGEEMMDEMNYHYGNYSEGREEYGRGNYGAKQDTIKSLEYMMESVVDFIEMLQEEAGSQEEVNLIKHYTKKISEM